MAKQKNPRARRYVAVYRRDPNEEYVWLVHIAGIPRCHTFGRSLSAARARIREALGLWVDDAKRVEIVDRIELPRMLRGTVSAATRARAALRTAEARRDEAARRAARALAAEGFSTRDAGEMLEYSQQRIAQLLVEE